MFHLGIGTEPVKKVITTVRQLNNEFSGAAKPIPARFPYPFPSDPFFVNIY